jgi:hypothetical protein
MRSLLSLFLIISAGVCFAAPVPPPDKLLAADTLALVTITDYQKARTDWDRSPLVKLWNDSGMKAFREKFDTKLKADLIEPLEREFGIKFADYKDLAQGQLTLALTRGIPTDKGDPTLGFVFLLDTKDKGQILKTNLATLKNKWIESGKGVKNEKIRDVEFTTLIFSASDISKTVDKVLPSPKKDKEEEATPEESKPAKKQEWLVGQSESLLIVATSAKDVEKILIRQSGGAVPSLSEYGPFAANYGPLFRDTSTYAWLDLKTILDFATRKPPKAGDEPEEPGPDRSKFLSVLGIAGLQSLAFTLKDSSEGCLLTTAISAPEASRRGLIRILSHEARDAGPPPFVPHDAVKFTRWRIDLPKAWTALETTLTDLDPAYARLIKLFVDNAGKDKDPNFDLRKSLIANLGDDLIVYEKKPKAATLAAMDKPPTIYLLSSPRPEQMAAAVKSLTAFLPQPSRFKEREFLGRKVFSVTIPSATETAASSARQPAEERILSYAASGSYVVFSTDTALFEEYLRALDTRPLREMPGLAQAAEKVGGMATGLFGFENQQESMRVIFEALKKDAASIDDLLSGSRLAGKLAGDEDKKFKEWFDFSLLPEFDRIAKYFHIAVWSGAVTTEGISFKWFSPAPPGAK